MKEHDVITKPNIIKRVGLEFLFYVYSLFMALPEIVGANNDVCDVAERGIIESR